MKIQIVSPIVSDIYGDSYKDAIKNFVKINHNMKLNNIIFKDQADHYKANLKYYMEDGRNKVGIDMYPINYNSMIINDTFLPSSQPLSPLFSHLMSPLSPMSPMMTPFIPTVIEIPNI